MTDRRPDHVALLRAVNVAGANNVPMAELRDLFAEIGFGGARTYLQSGNVLFAAGRTSRAKLTASIERALSDRFGYKADVMVRSAAELKAAHAASPYIADEPDPTRVHIAFLGAAPSKAAVSRLDPALSPDDELTVIGSEVHLHYGPAGSGRSKLNAAYLTKALGTTVTARNIRTVEALLAMLDES